MNVRRRWQWPAAMGWLLVLTLNPMAYGRTSLTLKPEVATGQEVTTLARTPVSGVMLVLNTMPELRRRQLALSLAKLVAIADKKKNPLFVSLDDSEERPGVGL
jgi:hypothetical protein